MRWCVHCTSFANTKPQVRINMAVRVSVNKTLCDKRDIIDKIKRYNGTIAIKLLCAEMEAIIMQNENPLHGDCIFTNKHIAQNKSQQHH